MHGTGKRFARLRCLVAVAAASLAAASLGSCGSASTERHRSLEPGKRVKPRQRAPSAPAIVVNGSALGRNQAPPAGVAEQLSYAGVGDGSCALNHAAVPHITFLRKFFAYKEEYDPKKNDEPVIGEEMYICFPGFNDHRPIAVTVKGPDGRVHRYLAHPLPEAAIFLPIELLPGDRLGSYSVAARQGAALARANYAVRDPNKPLARVITWRNSVAAPQASRRRRGPVRVVIVGLNAHKRFSLRIYRRKSGSTNYRYVTSLPVQLDANGEALVDINTNTASLAGSYLVFPTVRGLFSEGSALTFDLT